MAGSEGYAALRTSAERFIIPLVPPPQRQVVLVGFDGVQLLNLIGPAELLDAATQVLGDGRGYRVVIASADGKPVRGSAGMRLGADRSLGHIRPRTVDTLIVGGGMRVGAVVDDPRLRSGLQRISPAARDGHAPYARVPSCSPARASSTAEPRQPTGHSAATSPAAIRAFVWSRTGSSFATVQ